MLNYGDLLQNGRYHILRKIGSGGQGTVYEAEDQELNTKVALKEAHVKIAQLRRALKTEAQRLANLRHTALPNVRGYFVEGHFEYLVMEYIAGDNLAEQLDQQGDPFSMPDVLAWAYQLLDVLTYLHMQQPPVIHRDIKPDNIKLTPDNQIILLDFGIAKGGLPGDPNTLVYAHTRGYAPPEQMTSDPTDERSDLYAVGATLYHLLTGHQPEEALKRAQKLYNGESDPVFPANELNPKVPPAIAEVLAKAMALDAKERPASAVEMGDMLKQASNPPPPPPPPPPSLAWQRWVALLLVVSTIIALTLWRFVPPAPITFTFECSTGITDTVSAGGRITLATNDFVLIKPSRMPVSAEASDGTLRLLAQEYSYKVPTDTERVNINFILVNEDTNESTTTLFLTVVPELGGLCYR
jgi:serine/threonine protein kinase